MGERGPRPKYEATKLLKLTPELMAEIQAFAAAHAVTDSEAMRQLLAAGLQVFEAAPPPRRKR